MSDAIKQAPASSKTYYVISRTGGNRYLGTSGVSLGPWRKTVAEAVQHATVRAAAIALAEYVKPILAQYGWADLGIAITRITETPAGPSTIRLVSTRTIDATKPVVLFNAKRQVYLRVGASNALYVATDIQSATVFTDLGEAIRAEAENLRDILRRGSRPLEPLDTVHVHQVEVVPGTSTITETVLA